MNTKQKNSNIKIIDQDKKRWEAMAQRTKQILQDMPENKGDVIDCASVFCFGLTDNEIKLLYERNSRLVIPTNDKKVV